MVKKETHLLERVREHGPLSFGIPSIAAYELYFGAFKSNRVEDNLLRIEQLRVPIVNFDREDAEEAGRLRALLAAAGTPIGPYDILIAGQAKARSLVLITRNMREFSRVPGLQVEDWETQMG